MPPSPIDLIRRRYREIVGLRRVLATHLDESIARANLQAVCAPDRFPYAVFAAECRRAETGVDLADAYRSVYEEIVTGAPGLWR